MSRLQTTVVVAVLVFAVPASGRDLTFAERVAAQAAVERVYRVHREGGLPPGDPALQPVHEAKVRDYLDRSRELEERWGRPITAEMLRRELERLARETRMPERLRDLFAALNDDPFLIQETLVRDVLSGRLLRRPPGDGRSSMSKAGLSAPAPQDFRSTARIDVPLPPIRGLATAGESTCPDGEWEPLVDREPQPRLSAPAVWTGTEMLVWSGLPEADTSGDRYDADTDTWSPLATAGAPRGRYDHTAVWTGTEMLVWGGRTQAAGTDDVLGDGGRYDPATDDWASISMEGAPSPRNRHTAVWTGAEMIVWGGSPNDSSGGRYDPATDQWTATNQDQAPPIFGGHTAAWTGTEMIVWGTLNAPSCDAPVDCRGGGRYDPATDTWSPMSKVGSPEGVIDATGVWTGSEFIVWGGRTIDGTQSPGGGRYDPVADAWTPMTEVGAAYRFLHTTVWTGERMLVWGGRLDRFDGGDENTGAAYDPVGDVWTDLPTIGAPVARADHAAVWTGLEMIVWGGEGLGYTRNSGGRFHPSSGQWLPTAASDTPSPVSFMNFGTGPSEAVWTGSELIVWTGVDSFDRPASAKYDPALQAWLPISTENEPVPRTFHSITWTGSEMIVWGGDHPSGGRYDPVSDTWTPMSSDGAPPNLAIQTAVWTGSELIVWGSDFTVEAGEGGRYDPISDTWTPTSTVGAPHGSTGHSAVWTGTEMIVFGGRTAGAANFAGSARYDPATDTWVPTSTQGAPQGRWNHSAVWTGSEMIVWGGSYRHGAGADSEMLRDGGRYDPVSDSWTPTDLPSAPLHRQLHRAVWTGSEMLVWGGETWEWPTIIGVGPLVNDGARYDPVSDQWTPLKQAGAPAPRRWFDMHFTGEGFIVWGGGTYDVRHTTGGLYRLLPDSDGDGRCGASDCDEADDATYAGAPEQNDGVDNQCPGDPGFGLVDEVTGPVLIGPAGLHWTPQLDATNYEVVRSPVPGFGAGCVAAATPTASFDDGFDPVPGEVAYYLVRALEPFAGSFGQDSAGVPRAICPE